MITNKKSRFKTIEHKKLYETLKNRTISNGFTRESGAVVPQFGQWWTSVMDLDVADIEKKYVLISLSRRKGYSDRFITEKHSKLYKELGKIAFDNEHKTPNKKSVSGRFSAWWNTVMHLTIEEIKKEFQKSRFSKKRVEATNRFVSPQHEVLYNQLSLEAINNGFVQANSASVCGNFCTWWKKHMHLSTDEILVLFKKSSYSKKKGHDDRFISEEHLKLYKRLSKVAKNNGYIAKNGSITPEFTSTWWKKVMHLEIAQIEKEFINSKYNHPKGLDRRFNTWEYRKIYDQLSLIAIQNGYVVKNGKTVSCEMGMFWNEVRDLSPEDIFKEFQVSKLNRLRGLDDRFASIEQRNLFEKFIEIARNNGFGTQISNGALSWWWKQNDCKNKSLNENNELFLKSRFYSTYDGLYSDEDYIESLVLPIANEVKSVFVEFKSRTLDKTTRAAVKTEFISAMSKVTDDKMLCEVLANNYLALSCEKRED